MNNIEFYNFLLECMSYAGCNFSVRSYSGRGMYGKECIAIVSSENGFALGASLVAEAAVYEKHHDIADILAYTKQDSMANQAVYYWPKMEWNDEEMAEVGYDD